MLWSDFFINGKTKNISDETVKINIAFLLYKLSLIETEDYTAIELRVLLEEISEASRGFVGNIFNVKI